MLAAALLAEVAYVEAHAGEVDEQSQRLVVRARIAEEDRLRCAVSASMRLSLTRG